MARVIKRADEEGLGCNRYVVRSAVGQSARGNSHRWGLCKIDRHRGVRCSGSDHPGSGGDGKGLDFGEGVIV